MSRSGYSDDCDNWALVRWRGAVNAAIKGARGQQMLRELLAALDAMPEKILAADSLVTADGEYCTLGALGAARGLELSAIDPEDRTAVAKAFGIAEALAAEIMYLNDEGFFVEDRTYFNFEVCGPMRPWEKHTQLRWKTNPEAGSIRWAKMRQWVASQIQANAPSDQQALTA